MGAKQKNSEETVELLFPTTGYKKTLFFNKFAIEDAGVGLRFAKIRFIFI